MRYNLRPSVTTKIKTLKTKFINLSLSSILVAMSLGGTLPVFVTQKAAAFNNSCRSVSIQSTTPSSRDSISGNSYTVSAKVSDPHDCVTKVTYTVDANISGFGLCDLSNIANGTLSARNGDTYSSTLDTSALPKTADCLVWDRSITSYTFHFKAYADGFNNNATAEADSVTVAKDTTPPAKPTATPAGGLYNAAQSVTLSSSDEANGSGLDGIYYTTDGSTPDKSSIKYTTAITVAHSETINAVAYDNAGHNSEIGTFAYSIDTTAPDVPTLTGPQNNGYYNVNTNDFDFTWNAVTDQSTPVTYEWESSLGNATNPDGSFSSRLAYNALTTTSLNEGHSQEGTYYWHVRACDAAGNCSAWATPWMVTVDTTAPTVSVTPSASLLRGTTTFTITLHDQNLSSSKNKSVWVYLYDSAGAQKSQGAKVDLSSGSGTFTVDTTKLDDGKAVLDVGIVYDAAGNPTVDPYHPSGTDSYFSGYTIDNTRPVVTFTQTPHSIVSGNFDVTATITDANGIDPTSLVLQAEDLGSNARAAKCVAGTLPVAYNADNTQATLHCTIDTSALQEGYTHYVVWAWGKDIAGNSSSNIMGQSEIPFVVDRTAPTIQIDGATPGAIYGAADPLNFFVDDANLAHTYFYQGTALVKDYTNYQYFGASWLPEGTYEVYSVDAAGTESTHYTFTLDKTAPALTITSETPNSDGTYTIAGTTTDPTSTVSVALDGTTLAAITQSGNDWSVVTAKLTAGSSHTVAVDSTDAAGNVGTQQVATFQVPLPQTPQNDNDDTISSNTVTHIQQLTTGGHLLGASTTNMDTGNTSSGKGQVKGDNINLATNKKSDKSSTHNSAFLGLGWWWLAVLAVLGLLFVLFGKRRQNKEA